MKPYYQDDFVTLYHGDAREAPPGAAVVVTDPPYPNNADWFTADVETAREFCRSYVASHWLVFWHQLETPPVPLPLIAQHIWHRTNTNRRDNYEAIYEFEDTVERASIVFPYPVVYPGLTGCKEATGHPTQKPERLMRRLLALCKGTDGFVLDPFAGSGSTLVAAKSLGLAAVGVEREAEFCAQAARRLGQEVLDFGAAS